ncbi:MAG TPA: ribose-5-phosphate isomerase RpiA [Chitinophagaceae bacterium]|jgi:ribose 5-phosphate isomerase A
MLTSNDIKKHVGTVAVDIVEPGMVLGVGTGTTVYWFIIALAEKIKNGLDCKAVPTSTQTEALAKQHNIPLLALNDVERIALTIDGADEVTPGLQLIKGGGGALLQEKMVAAASERLVIIADNTKLVPHLGRFPLPVEVVRYGWKQVQRHIHQLYSIDAPLRIKNGSPVVTDHGHYILDCPFGRIHDAPALAVGLNTLPGVVDNGLFIRMATQALIGFPDGIIKTLSCKD